MVADRTSPYSAHQGRRRAQDSTSGPSPRHPRLVALLEANQAALRVRTKRAARLALRAAGITNVEVR